MTTLWLERPFDITVRICVTLELWVSVIDEGHFSLNAVYQRNRKLSWASRWLTYNIHVEWKNSTLTIRWRKQGCLSDVFFICFIILVVCTDQVLLFDEWMCKCCLMMCQQVFAYSLTADWFRNLYFDILEIPDKISAGEKVSETCHVTVLDAKYFFPNNCGLTFCVWIYKIVSVHYYKPTEWNFPIFLVLFSGS